MIVEFFAKVHALLGIVKRKYKECKTEAVPQVVTELISFMMKQKKAFEVTNLVRFLLPRLSKHKTKALIDVGCGQGYLSYVLAAAKPDLQVLGIDGKKSNVAAFEQRIKEVTKRHRARISGSSADYLSRFRLESLFVNEENMMTTIEDKIPPDQNPLLITLHGCGDLSSTLVKMFALSTKIKRLFLVSCCFNLLTESVSEPARKSAESTLCAAHTHNDLTTRFAESPSPDKSCGYPLSEYMRSSHPTFFLGRNIRCAAAASISFLLEGEQGSGTLDKMIYRAGIEVFDVGGR